MKQLIKRVQEMLNSHHPFQYVYFVSLAIILILFFTPLLFEEQAIAGWMNPNNSEKIAQPTKEEIAQKELEKQEALNKQKQEREEQAKLEAEEAKNRIKEVVSDDPNVSKAYEGEFDIYPTEQTGEHYLTFQDGSMDRIEIHEAASQVLAIDSDQLLDYWLSTTGEENHLYIVLTDLSYENFYRIYMHFIDGKGWQVTRYEVLNELTGEG